MCDRVVFAATEPGLVSSVGAEWFPTCSELMGAHIPAAACRHRWLLTCGICPCCAAVCLPRRDPTQRPTAKEALKHPWLRGNSSERSMGRQIDLSVVQRIQRFAQNNHFKRSVLQLIAEELLSRPGALQSAAASVYAAEEDEDMAEAAAAAGAPAAEEAEEGTPQERSCPLGADGRPIITGPNSSPMQHIFERMRFKGEEVLEREQVAAALEEMGYRLAPCEVQRLVEQVRERGAYCLLCWRHVDGCMCCSSGHEVLSFQRSYQGSSLPARLQARPQATSASVVCLQGFSCNRCLTDLHHPPPPSAPPPPGGHQPQRQGAPRRAGGQPGGLAPPAAEQRGRVAGHCAPRLCRAGQGQGRRAAPGGDHGLHPRQAAGGRAAGRDPPGAAGGRGWARWVRQAGERGGAACARLGQYGHKRSDHSMWRRCLASRRQDGQQCSPILHWFWTCFRVPSHSEAGPKLDWNG